MNVPDQSPAGSGPATPGSGTIEVLTFGLQGETFALEATAVQEILDLLPETPVPGAGRFVGSVINFRGRVIPLADLRLAFGMDPAEPTADSRIVVIEFASGSESTLVGLRTDRVHEVTILPLESREPPPGVGMRWRPDYIRALFRHDGEFIILPDLDAIFTASPPRVGTTLRAVN
ncbi:MAG: chemotaxis protein CheW [Rubellimicrobium sp.]|nr:chemotaxis protein CheW [Rubellimicrobium sp.]